MIPFANKMKMLLRLLAYLSTAIVLSALLGAIAIIATYHYLAPQLPSIDSLRDVQLQVPLRVFDRDGLLLAEFGETRRTPINYEQMPPLGVKAFLAAEDDRFFEHPGVDYQGILRAVYVLLLTGERSQGGSTITMQVARNFFLSREKTYLRKLNEIFLALRIEQELSKQEILELYLNKIYLGQRSYGVGAAAETYYGRPLDQLNIAELAMIAGLPKAPSAYNPVTDPERALQRRNYVLRRMHELGHIDDDQLATARAAPLTARLHHRTPEIEAPYVAEMVRAEMVARYGNDAYNGGYRVYTTLDGKLQVAANQALRSALLGYSRRHGYRGVEATIDLTQYPERAQQLQQLTRYTTVGALLPALVIATDDEAQTAQLLLATGAELTLPWQGMAWARPYLDDDRTGAAPKQVSDVLQLGDLIRVERSSEGWQLAEIPEVAGALVALNPDNGAIVALTGGFDFYHSKFNRVTQAKRQPGSNFKPFIYSAALEHGYTTATLVNDAPVVFEDATLEATWRPENYSGRFYGPTRLREGLIKSRNLISIRLLQDIGIQSALDHVQRFGFDPAELSRDLSLALGSAVVTPIQLVQGYAVLANGGYQVTTHLIGRIEDDNGNLIEQAAPATVCEGCRDLALPPAPQVVDPRNIYLINSMLQDVITDGTARRARALNRTDLAGKTGTTNDQRDAWFSGFNRDIVATAWVGFDNPRPLGKRETGGRAALPMWMEFIGSALDGKPMHTLAQPAGITTIRIDPKTGAAAANGQRDAIFELFRVENVPRQQPQLSIPSTLNEEGIAAPIDQQLF